MLALGIDIVKGNPLSRTIPPIYAAVIVDGNGIIIQEIPEAPLNTVIRLAWDYNVDRIGVDNIYELAPTSKDVARILSLFPSRTEIYQVTLDSGSFASIFEQVSKVGITLTSKPKPIQTAYICALLAIAGIGTPIRGVERKTKIIVTRIRSIGPGGSSANRYARGMRTAVLRAVKEIKMLLDNEKLDYDLVIKKSSGGLDSAVFTVYADSARVRAVIKPRKGRDVRIIIKPVYSDIITIHSDNDKRRPLIIGLDPGIETGIAIIDLSLNVLHLESSKSLDRLDIIDRIYKYGIPILIAVDKNPPPESAKKLASMLGVQLFIPNESLTTEVKDRLIDWLNRKKNTNIVIDTTHEKDALAAALKAYKTYEKKFIELERKILEIDLDIDIDELKALVLKGYDISKVIEYAIDKHLTDMSHSAEVHQSQGAIRSVPICDDKVKSLEAKVQNLLTENELLRNRLREIENKLEVILFEKKFDLGLEYDVQVLQDRFYTRLNEYIKQLQSMVSSLRNEIERLINEKNKYIDMMIRITSRKAAILRRLKSPLTGDPSTIKDTIGAYRLLVIDREVLPYNFIDYARQTKLILLFKKCTRELEELFISNGVPIICNIDFEEVSEDFVMVDLDKLEEALIEVANKLYSAKKVKSLSINDVINIIDEYRKSLEYEYRYQNRQYNHLND